MCATSHSSHSMPLEHDKIENLSQCSKYAELEPLMATKLKLHILLTKSLKCDKVKNIIDEF